MTRNSSDKAPRELSVSQLLAAVPQKNEAMTVETIGDDVVVSVPLRRPAWLVPPISWVLPFSGKRRVQLDATGTAVLELCDGRRTVEEVVESLAEKHKLSFRESQLAVTQFLKDLLQRGIIVIIGTNEND